MPKVRHSSVGKTKSDLERLAKAFAVHRMLPMAKRLAVDLGDINWKDPKQLLELRKRLRDHVKAAFEDRDDRYTKYVETGETTNDGHEPEIALLAAMIDWHISDSMRRHAAW